MLLAILLLLFAPAPAAGLAQETATVEADQYIRDGDAAFDQGTLDEARRKYESAIKIYREQNNQPGIANGTYKLGRTNGRLGNFQEALRLFEQALKIHEELGDQEAAGLDYTRIAMAQERQGNYKEALAASEKALAINEKTGNQEGIAITRDNIGNCYYRLGEYEKAIDSFQKALPAAEKSGDPSNVATVLGNLSQVYWALGDYPRALDRLDQALKIAETMKDPELTATNVANKALIYWEQGDFRRAQEGMERSLVLFQQVGNQDHVAGHYMNMGAFQYQIGNYEKGLESLQKSVKMAQELKDKGLEADASGQLGRVYEELGDRDAALNYIQRALRLTEEIGEKRSTIDILLQLGYFQEREQETAEALSTYQKALRLCEQIGLKSQTADSLQKIAAVYAKKGDHDRELEMQKRALALRESLGDRAGIGEGNMLLGSAYYSKRDWANADAALTKAIDILKDVGWPDVLWPALYKKALVCRDTGKTTESLQWMKEAVQVIERLRGTVDLPEQKSAFLEDRLDVYEDLVLLLVKSGDIAGAYEYAERSRARAFLDLLSETRIEPQSGLSKEQYDRKQQLLTQLVNLRTKIHEEHEKEEPDNNAIRRYAEREGKLDAEYLNLMIEIRKQNRRHADLQDPEPIRLPEVQALIDPDSAAAEYFVGKKESVLFLITPGRIEAYHLPGQQKLEEQVRGLLDAIQKPEPVWEATSGSYTRYRNLAGTLYGEILKPAEALLKGKRRIILVPDGPLHYLPFESLLTGAGPGTADFSKLPYLGLQYETQYVPSMSSLAALRSNAHADSAGQRKKLIAFADPLAEGGNTGGLHQPGAGDTAVREWSSKLSPLPYARVEAEDISKLFPRQDVTLLIGKDATESGVKNAALDQYKMIHFASHGMIDEDRPQFSALVLNPGNGEDGFLTMREIFDLKLDADLVVLSACKTGLGRRIRGEGIAGLSRAFFSAGTARVVVSLWNVFDASTAEFMTDFYQDLEKQHMKEARALKDARTRMIREGKFSHPYYWAPFILVGDN